MVLLARSRRSSSPRLGLSCKLQPHLPWRVIDNKFKMLLLHSEMQSSTRRNDSGSQINGNCYSIAAPEPRRKTESCRRVVVPSPSFLGVDSLHKLSFLDLCLSFRSNSPLNSVVQFLLRTVHAVEQGKCTPKW